MNRLRVVSKVVGRAVRRAASNARPRRPTVHRSPSIEQRSGLAARIAARPRDARGQSLSVLVIVIMIALILTAGLVIDGGQKVTATSRAESAAAAAARVGSEAGATDALAGRPDADRAAAAARAYLAGGHVDGQVDIVGGRVRVHTGITEPTLMLSLIGIDAVVGTGDAESELVGSDG